MSLIGKKFSHAESFGVFMRSKQQWSRLLMIVRLKQECRMILRSRSGPAYLDLALSNGTEFEPVGRLAGSFSDGLKPSRILRADRYWSQFWEAGVISLHEAERRALGSLRLKKAYSSDPWYAKKAARDPSFWSRFYATRVNS